MLAEQRCRTAEQVSVTTRLVLVQGSTGLRPGRRFCSSRSGRLATFTHRRLSKRNGGYSSPWRSGTVEPRSRPECWISSSSRVLNWTIDALALVAQLDTLETGRFRRVSRPSRNGRVQSAVRCERLEDGVDDGCLHAKAAARTVHREAAPFPQSWACKAGRWRAPALASLRPDPSASRPLPGPSGCGSTRSGRRERPPWCRLGIPCLMSGRRPGRSAPRRTPHARSRPERPLGALAVSRRGDRR